MSVKQDRRPSDARLIRAEKAMSMYLRGHSTAQIAEVFTVSARRIRDDLVLIRELWRDRASASYDEHVAAELARINEVEQAAWDGWERSQKNGDDNPQFLIVVLKSIDQRRRLLLLDSRKPPKEETERPMLCEVVIDSYEQAQRVLTLGFEDYEARVVRG